MEGAAFSVGPRGIFASQVLYLRSNGSLTLHHSVCFVMISVLYNTAELRQIQILPPFTIALFRHAVYETS